MKLNEFYDPEQDKLERRSVDDTRKSKLTLDQLNKLRRIRDIKMAEKKRHDEFVKIMYATPTEEPGGQLGGF